MNQRQAAGMGDELTNAALIGLIGMFGIALALRAAGSVAAFLTGTPQPDAGAAAGLAVLFNPGDPATALGADGLNPVVYWLVSTALLGGLAAGIVWVWIVLRRHTRKTETDPHRLAGIATSHEVKTAASAKALLHRAATLRPSLESPAPQDVGYLLGASRGTKVWASVEDSILLIGPPAQARACMSSSTRSSTHPERSSPPAPGPITSPRPSATDAARAGRSPCSTRNTSPRASPPGCAGRPFAGATIR